jgi:hypothetical protein
MEQFYSSLSGLKPTQQTETRGNESRRLPPSFTPDSSPDGPDEPPLTASESISAQSMAVATSDEKKAKELINEMARDDSTPVIYKDVGKAVMLETDSTNWVGDCIRRWDGDQLTWDLR